MLIEGQQYCFSFVLLLINLKLFYFIKCQKNNNLISALCTGRPLNIFTSASVTEKPILVDNYLKPDISSLFASPARFQFCLVYGVIVQWRPLRRRSWTANKKTHHRVFSLVRGKGSHVKFVQIPVKKMLIMVTVSDNKVLFQLIYCFVF